MICETCVFRVDVLIKQLKTCLLLLLLSVDYQSAQITHIMLTERHIRSIRTLLKAPRGRITSNPTGSSIVANNPAIMPALPATTPGEGQLAPPPPPEPERQAAVLIPLCIDKGEPSMLFTRRTRRMRRNTGEISFPGGRIDKGEESTPWVTALRETEEEIGIPRSRVR